MSRNEVKWAPQDWQKALDAEVKVHGRKFLFRAANMTAKQIVEAKNFAIMEPDVTEEYMTSLLAYVFHFQYTKLKASHPQ